MLVLNVIVVFWFNDKVLDGDFTSLGPNWMAAPNGDINYTQIHDNIGPTKHEMNKGEILTRTFPKRAECTVKWVGSAGDLTVTNYYCILGANSLAQYLFLFLWFWYTLLLAINVLNLVRIILMIQRIGPLRNVFLMSVVGSTKVIYSKILFTLNSNYLMIVLS